MLIHFLFSLATMSKNNFNFQFVIGRGGFGKVSYRATTSFSTLIIVRFKGVESRVSKDDADFRDERDVQGQDYIQTICSFCHEREETTRATPAPLPGQYQLRVPGP